MTLKEVRLARDSQKKQEAVVDMLLAVLQETPEYQNWKNASDTSKETKGLLVFVYLHIVATPIMKKWVSMGGIIGVSLSMVVATVFIWII